mmetsp:Transcript_51988/g.143930  ORF Transcript_51988/g.143930 Transcript_51988/m.143930 type:complete len:466 (-) Transcript_51988:3250-4647(-)
MERESQHHLCDVHCCTAPTRCCEGSAERPVGVIRSCHPPLGHQFRPQAQGLVPPGQQLLQERALLHCALVAPLRQALQHAAEHLLAPADPGFSATASTNRLPDRACSQEGVRGRALLRWRQPLRWEGGCRSLVQFQRLVHALLKRPRFQCRQDLAPAPSEDGCVRGRATGLGGLSEGGAAGRARVLGARDPQAFGAPVSRADLLHGGFDRVVLGPHAVPDPVVHPPEDLVELLPHQPEPGGHPSLHRLEALNEAQLFREERATQLLPIEGFAVLLSKGPGLHSVPCDVLREAGEPRTKLTLRGEALGLSRVAGAAVHGGQDTIGLAKYLSRDLEAPLLYALKLLRKLEASHGLLLPEATLHESQALLHSLRTALVCTLPEPVAQVLQLFDKFLRVRVATRRPVRPGLDELRHHGALLVSALQKLEEVPLHVHELPMVSRGYGAGLYEGGLQPLEVRRDALQPQGP